MAARIKKLSLMSLVMSFLFTATTLRAQDRDAVVLFIRQFSGNTTVAWPFDPRLLQAQASTEPQKKHVTPGAPARFPVPVQGIISLTSQRLKFPHGQREKMIPIVIIATAAVLFFVLERMLPRTWRRSVISSVSPPVLFTLAITLLAPIAIVLAGGVPLGHLPGDQELDVTDSDFARFTKYYYEAGSPDLAAKMLRDALSKNWSPSGGMQLQYFFARIAQLNPGTLRGYEALWSENTHTGRLFILSVLRLAGDEQTRQFLTARAREEDSKSEWPAIGAALSAGIPTRLNVLDASCAGSDGSGYIME